MNRLILPAQIHPPRLKRDGSASLSFETRELNADEYLMIMGFRNTEGWLCYCPNVEDIEIPKEDAQLDEKSPSERLKAVLYVWFKQEVESGRFLGLFETFRREKMESIIEGVKKKLI